MRTLHGRQPHEFVAVLGGYVGWGGRIAAWTRLGVLWDDPSLLDRAEHGVEQLLPGIAHDGALDVIAGSAGAIPALLALDAVRPASRAREAALLCGEHLATQLAGDHGFDFERGFSHGPAGAVWAFAQLHARTGDERWRELARTRAAAERATFADGWADADRPGRAAMCAWCHGAAGIALGRLEAWHLLGDAELLDDARRALAATRGAAPMPSQCLCHGRLGNLESLARARDLLDDPGWREAHDATLDDIVDDLRRRGACFAHATNLETPGLMTGLAGIGYGLLRSAHPERVPSVLATAT
jgi:lantibiotic modifying enzyme